MEKDHVMWRAVEADYLRSEEEAFEDRKLFVENLGWLLSQSREGIVGAYLDDQETVHVLYKHREELLVNVNMDSYMAIVSDVVKHIRY